MSCILLAPLQSQGDSEGPAVEGAAVEGVAVAVGVVAAVAAEA